LRNRTHNITALHRGLKDVCMCAVCEGASI